MNDERFSKWTSAQAAAFQPGRMSSLLERQCGYLAKQLRTIEQAVFEPWGLVDDILENDRAMKAMVGPLGNVEKWMQVLDTRWERETRRLTHLLSGVESRFRLPAVDESRQLFEKFVGSGFTSALAEAQNRMLDLQRTIESIHAPWLDVRDPMRSIGGLAGIQAIGRVLTVAPPFENSVTATLRSALGDWRPANTFPERIIDDPVARVDFYSDLGFDTALTDFPVTAFQQTLDLTGLRPSSLPPIIPEYDGWATPAPEAEEEDAFVRSVNAYRLLNGLETQLRDFVDKMLTEAFGEGWPKHRIPQAMYQSWKTKRELAIEHGEQPRRLIAYADFTDYIQIIGRKDNWQNVFKPIFKRREGIQESLYRLQPVRVCTMHAREITSDDKFLLYVETRRILKAIGRG